MADAAANGAGAPKKSSPLKPDTSSTNDDPDWRAQRNAAMGSVTVVSNRGDESPKTLAKKGSKEKPGVGKKKEKGDKKSSKLERTGSVHMTSESTLMDLDDSHIPDGATPFEKQMHERIKAMDRDGDGKITIQECPPSRPRLHLARPCPLPEWEQHSSAAPRRN